MRTTAIDLHRRPELLLAARLASFVLAAGPLYLLYQSDRALMEAEPAVDIPAFLTAPQTSRPSRTLLSAEQIADTKMMGEAAPPPAPAAPPPEKLPDTRLQLTLTGVFASPDPELAAALIKVGGEAPRYYKVGDEVTEGAVLYGVAGDGITLRRDREFERLAFERDRKESRRAVAVQQPVIIPRRTAPITQTVAAAERDDNVNPAAHSDGSTLSLKMRLEKLRQARQ